MCVCDRLSSMFHLFSLPHFTIITCTFAFSNKNKSSCCIKIEQTSTTCIIYCKLLCRCFVNLQVFYSRTTGKVYIPVLPFVSTVQQITNTIRYSAEIQITLYDRSVLLFSQTEMQMGLPFSISGNIKPNCFENWS